eukprot:3932535-Rhodomonas_salina.1
MQLQAGDNDTWVAGVATKGRPNAYYAGWFVDQSVTSFRVMTRTQHNSTWRDEGVFEGNTDRNTLVTNAFNKPVLAYYVRIYPLTWRQQSSMRAGLLLQDGCLDVDECAELGDAACVVGANCSNSEGSFACECGEGFVYSSQDGCQPAPGSSSASVALSGAPLLLLLLSGVLTFFAVTVHTASSTPCKGWPAKAGPADDSVSSNTSSCTSASSTGLGVVVVMLVADVFVETVALGEVVALLDVAYSVDSSISSAPAQSVTRSCVASRSTMASGCTRTPSSARSWISLADSVVLCSRKSENLMGMGIGTDVSCWFPKIMPVLPLGTSV